MDVPPTWELADSERRVLETVWRQGPLPRKAVAPLTGLAAPTITRIVRELEQRNLVFDEVDRAGDRGQPSRPLSINSDAAYAIGVYFSHSYMDVGMINLAGALVSSERVQFERASSRQIGEVAAVSFTRQVKAAGLPLSRIIGAGFALPGDFGETPQFLDAHAYFPDLAGQDMQTEFARILPTKVFVENDAASAALGERVHGIGRNVDSFLLVHIGHGIGGGLILDGRLYRGAFGNAGIIGVQYPNSEPRPSGQDLLESLQAAGLEVHDFNDLEKLSPSDCPPLRRWIARAAKQLEHGIHVTARLIDPQMVVLGGRLPVAILEALHRAIDVDAIFCANRVLPRPRIEMSRLGTHAGVIGAASIAMFDTFFQRR